MSLFHYNYMIVDNPPSPQRLESGKTAGHHIRLMPSARITQKQLVEKMHKLEPILSRGMCEVAIGVLSRAVGELLANGHLVTIRDIGTLQPHLTGDIVEKGRGPKVGNVRVSTINFTPDSELLNMANQGKPRLKRKGTRSMPSAKEVMAFLTDYFSQHDRLTRKAVIERFGITRYQAANLLHQLTANGTLVACGHRATAHYVRVEEL